MFSQPNTNIPLEDLTYKHLIRFMDCYEDIGLQVLPVCRKLLSQPGSLIREFQEGRELELTPSYCHPGNKLVIRVRYHEDKRYVHPFIVPNSQPDGEVMGLIKRFENLVGQLY